MIDDASSTKKSLSARSAELTVEGPLLERGEFTIVLATDHGGFALKEQLKPWLAQFGVVQDFGAADLDPADDYPDFGIPAARFVAEDPASRRGILLCASGNGMAVIANKLLGLRAIVVGHAAEFANDEYAPILALPGKFVSVDEAKLIIQAWWDSLNQPLADRHQRRIGKIEAMDRE